MQLSGNQLLYGNQLFDDGCYLMGHFTPKGWELGNSLFKNKK